MILAYTNSDTTASVVIGLIALVIGIAMLVFFISHMSRQTRGIEEIYKLLYQMQAKKPDKEGNGTNEITPTPYLQDLKEREEREKNANQEFVEQHEDKPLSTGGKIFVGIAILIFLSIIIAGFISSFN